MPEPDSLGGAKRKAKVKAAKYNYLSVKSDGRTVFVEQCIRFVASAYEPRWITRWRPVFTARTEAEAVAIAAALPPYGNRHSNQDFQWAPPVF